MLFFYPLINVEFDEFAYTPFIFLTNLKMKSPLKSNKNEKLGVIKLGFDECLMQSFLLQIKIYNKKYTNSLKNTLF